MVIDKGSYLTKCMKNGISITTYSLNAAKSFYFIAVASYTVSLLFFLPDNIKYARIGIMIIDLISSFFVFSSFILYLKKIIQFRIAGFFYMYSALLNIIFSSWYYYWYLPDYTSLLLICTFIYCINLAFGGLCLGYKQAFSAAILYIATIGPLMLSSQDPLLHRYWIIICLLIAAFAAGVSGFLQLLAKTYRNEMLLKEEIYTKDKALATEQEKLLNHELDFKQREIMAKTLFLVEHAENNANFITELNRLRPGLTEKEQQILDSIINLHRIDHHEKYWKDFETSFLQVHPDFYRQLSKICPQLSPAELKLAAFIRLGLSSKQIGSVSSNTSESIDVARSRLRTKLNLSPDANLKTFLLSL